MFGRKVFMVTLRLFFMRSKKVRPSHHPNKQLLLALQIE